MATKANIIIDQGATFSTTINLTDQEGELYDLSGYVGTAQMRKHYTSSNAISFSVTLDFPEPGAMELSLSAEQTANIAAGRYVYDVELAAPTGVVSRIVEGIVTITPNVTR